MKNCFLKGWIGKINDTFISIKGEPSVPVLLCHKLSMSDHWTQLYNAFLRSKIDKADPKNKF